MAEAPERFDREEYEAWLKTQPREVSVVMAARCALRVVPMLAPLARKEKTRALILQPFRGIVTPWVASTCPTQGVDLGNADAAYAADAAAAADAAYAAVDAVDAATAAYAAYAAAYAADADAAAYAAAYAADAFYIAAAATAATAATAYVLAGIRMDRNRLSEGLSPGDLGRSPILDEPAASHERVWAQMVGLLSAHEDTEHWSVWIDWYEARLRGDPVDEVLEIARLTDVTEDEWKAGPAVANARIKAIIQAHRSNRELADPDTGITEAAERFVLGHLAAQAEPVRTDAIRRAAESVGLYIKPSTLNWVLTNLVARERIRRVSRGLYAAIEAAPVVEDELSDEADIPPPPAEGPGPKFVLNGAQLSRVGVLPEGAEAAAQSRRHASVRRAVNALTRQLGSVGNMYPGLTGAVQAYADAVEADTAALDVETVWELGGALASYSAAFGAQDARKTLTEPLEPELAAELQHTCRLHAALIMGFDEGRELVDSTDRFFADPESRQDMEAHGEALLDALVDSPELFDEKANAANRTLHDSLRELGWTASRAGYAGYLTLRSATRAIIRFTVGRDPNLFNMLGGGLAAAAVAAMPQLAPHVEFARHAASFLGAYGTQLCLLFRHSPDMLAYVEWALSLLASDKPTSERED